MTAPLIRHLRLAIALLAAATPAARAAGPDDKRQAKPPSPLARLFVQDGKTSTLKWADVRLSAAGDFALGALAPVEGFPPLDAGKQKFVQMEQIGGLVCVGVRDTEAGAFGSGWVLLRAGVEQDDHGDHAHWAYPGKPAVVDARLDKAQGNPAHLYRSGGYFYVVNDKLGGATRVDPAKYIGSGKDAPRFLAGGGGHITMAVAGDKVLYATWIDAAGPNRGRVDVTPLAAGGKNEPAYSFRLPSGGLHGAIANSGKVFFAPSDGVSWVEADPDLKLTPARVKSHHIPLGKDGDKPRRTGAFVAHGHHVAFVTGKGASPSLVLLNARDAEPKPITVPLGDKPGTQAVTPAVVTTHSGKAYAFVFRDRAKDADAEDALEVVALDPNNDGNCSDAKVVKTLKVGTSAASGHAGHHDLSFDAEGRYGFFTNPGDGTVSVLSLKDLDVVATFEVGGAPGAIVAVGGRATDD